MTNRGAVVLSLSPALDRTVRVEQMQPGGVHRPTWTDERAGGKGANVVRTLHRHGVPASLVTALGGVLGDAFRVLARREGLTVVGVSVQAPTRVCTTVLDRHGATSFYEQAGELTAQDWAELFTAVRALLPTRALVLTGSLPPGLPASALGDLAAAARSAHTPLWADVGGPGLCELASYQAVVWPNLFEARQAMAPGNGGQEPVHGHAGGPVAGAAAARALVDMGAAAAAVSCGPDGVALAVRHGYPRHFAVAPTVVRNPVGAGDVLLGATLAVLSNPNAGQPQLERALAYGARLASLSCQTDAAADLPEEIELHDSMRPGSRHS